MKKLLFILSVFISVSSLAQSVQTNSSFIFQNGTRTAPTPTVFRVIGSIYGDTVYVPFAAPTYTPSRAGALTYFSSTLYVFNGTSWVAVGSGGGGGGSAVLTNGFGILGSPYNTTVAQTFKIDTALIATINFVKNYFTNTPAVTQSVLKIVTNASQTTGVDSSYYLISATPDDTSIFAVHHDQIVQKIGGGYTYFSGSIGQLIGVASVATVYQFDGTTWNPQPRPDLTNGNAQKTAISLMTNDAFPVRLGTNGKTWDSIGIDGTRYWNKYKDIDTVDYITTFKIVNGRVDTVHSNQFSLTTIGSSGAATFNPVTGVLNIPSYSGGGSSGTVTSVSGLSPLFTVSNATTTPTFALSNAAAHTFFGNNTGSTATPSYSAINEADVTNLTSDLAGKQPLITLGTTGQYFDGTLALRTFPTIPAQFNPIAGTNITLSGAYPNITFNATATGVTSFNTRTGAVTLNSSDVTTALGFTPENITNKATSFGTLNNTLYPTTQAVSNYVTGLGYINQTTGDGRYVLQTDGSYVKSVVLNTPNVLYTTPINFTTATNTATGTLTLNTQSAKTVFSAPTATTPSFNTLDSSYITGIHTQPYNDIRYLQAYKIKAGTNITTSVGSDSSVTINSTATGGSSISNVVNSGIRLLNGTKDSIRTVYGTAGNSFDSTTNAKGVTLNIAGLPLYDSTVINDSVYFWGNSIPAGTGTSGTGTRYTSLVAAGLKTFEANKAISGTRFVRGSAGDSSFIDRFYSVPAWRNTIRYIVLDYFTNDCTLGTGLSSFQTNLYNYIDSLTINRNYPANRIVLIAPSYLGTNSGGYGKNNDTLKLYCNIVKAASIAKGTLFVDVNTYFLNNGKGQLINLDSTHPNNAGHWNYAKIVLSTIGGAVNATNVYIRNMLAFGLSATVIGALSWGNTNSTFDREYWYTDGTAANTSGVGYNSTGITAITARNSGLAFSTGQFPSTVTLANSAMNIQSNKVYINNIAQRIDWANGTFGDLLTGYYGGASASSGYGYVSGTGATAWFGRGGIPMFFGIGVDASNITSSNATFYIDGNNFIVFNKGVSFPYAAKSANYNLTNSDHTIEVTATGQTITLPTAVGITGRVYTIKLTASGSCTIATTSSQTIDGSTTYSLASQYKYVTVQSNNANWMIIANN